MSSRIADMDDTPRLLCPFFLHSGGTYYAQVHAPFTTKDPNLDPSPYSGVAEKPSEDVLKIFVLEKPMRQGKKDYYEEVILEDEKRLLISLATDHIMQVGEGTVSGEKRVTIQDEKSVIEVEEGVWNAWTEYEKRGSERRS